MPVAEFVIDLGQRDQVERSPRLRRNQPKAGKIVTGKIVTGGTVAMPAEEFARGRQDRDQLERSPRLRRSL